MGTFYINFSFEQKIEITHNFAVDADSLEEAVSQIKESISDNNLDLLNMDYNDSNICSTNHTQIKGCEPSNLCLYDTENNIVIDM